MNLAEQIEWFSNQPSGTDKESPRYLASRAILASLQKLALCEQNSRRYEWLRAGGVGTGLYVANSGNDWRAVKSDALDAAIDAALETP